MSLGQNNFRIIYGPILENFQNTGDLGVKILKTQFYFLGPKNFLELVQNDVYRIRICVRTALVNTDFLLLADNCN